MTQTGRRQFAAFIMKYCEYNRAPGTCPCGCDSNRDIATGNLPSGWRLIGQGSYRWAFVGPDGYVYKVDKRKTSQTNSGNLSEADNFRRIAGVLPERVYIPKWDLYEFSGDRFVMVMELVESDLKFGYCDFEYEVECHCDEMGVPSVFEDLLAQEDGGCWSRWMSALGEDIGLYDLHEDNLYPQSDGRVALIDGGF